MSNATIGYGLTLAVETAAGAIPLAYTELAEVTSFQPPSDTVDDIDVTHMKSPDSRREFIPGLSDPGTASATFNHVPASATDVFINTWRSAREIRKVKGTYADGSTVTFSGYVQNYTVDNIPVDGKMASTLAIKISGAVTVEAAP